MRCLKSTAFSVGLTKIEFLTYGQRKWSQTVKSRDVGGKSFALLLLIIGLSKSFPENLNFLMLIVKNNPLVIHHHEVAL